MSTTTLHTTITKKKLSSILLSLPQGLSSNLNSTSEEYLTLVANTLLGKIREAFLIKSQGGTDSAGDRWAPLKPKTIQAKITRYGKAKRAKNSDPHDPAMRRIRSIIRKGGSGTILVGTGELLKSLSPNSTSKYQVLRVLAGNVTLGTTRPGAMAHHYGVLNRLPQRKLWPDKFPPQWWDEILKVIQSLVAKEITNTI